MKLAFSIARRFLTSSKMQTVLIALGIAIGVSVQVFIGTLIMGLQASLLDTTIGSSSHITVKPEKDTDRIADYDKLITKIQKTDSTIKNISAAADASGFIKTSDNTYPVLARGFEFPAADGIYKISASLVDGSLPSGDEIILGKELMEKAGLLIGDSVDILTPEGGTTTVTISGVFDLKVASINTSWAIAEMSLVQDIFNFGNEVTSIEMQIANVFDADIIAPKVKEVLPAGLTVTDWKTQNAALLSGLNGQSISSLMIQIFVMISVVLGIASVLAISVLQKSKQLGILKAMGIKNRTASLIFLFQGFILGVLGAALGIGLGLLLTTSFTTFATNPDGTPIIKLLIEPGFIILSGLVAVAASTIASLIPARRSSKLDPIEVIKNG